MFWCYILKACGLTVLFLSLTNRNPKVVWCGHRVLLPPKSHECILCILLFNRYSLKEREREWELYLKWERHELLSTQQKAVSSLVLKKKKIDESDLCTCFCYISIRDKSCLEITPRRVFIFYFHIENQLDFLKPQRARFCKLKLIWAVSRTSLFWIENVLKELLYLLKELWEIFCSFL